MNPHTTDKSEPRRVFMILSPRSLSYARHALKSLLCNALEAIHLHLITDSALDKNLLAEEMASCQHIGAHRWTIYGKEDLRDQEAVIFARYPNLRLFRDGHPCWRKITDPLLLSGAEEEILVLDPDLYFPNRFTFQPTPAQGVLLMWQRPNCLLPREIVERAFRKRIPLAHHVDIGVAQWRSRLDLEWLDWLVDQLDVARHPNAMFIMHIEAIVWAAIAMRAGGGYLPRKHWRIWHRSQSTRLGRKLGVPGHQLLRREPFSAIKCFHAGGEAKYWLQEAKQRGWLDHDQMLDMPGPVRPFVELTPGLFQADKRLRSLLRKIGYYRFFPGGSLP